MVFREPQNRKAPPQSNDIALSVLGYILISILWAITIVFYLSLPKNIPFHFTVSGRADRYGSKINLLCLTGLATVIFVCFTLLIHSRIFLSYGSSLYHDKMEYKKKLARQLFGMMRVFVTLIFLLFMILIFTTSVGVTKGLGGFFVPAVVILLLLPVLFFLVRVMLENRP